MSELLSLLPARYAKSAQVVVLQEAINKWTEALDAAREDLFLQMHVATATWGLAVWEKELGLETNISHSLERRRERIESKLRGLGTTTKAMMQNVAESFSNGQVEIIEYNSEYRFEVKFTGTVGMPPNMDDLTAAIEEIKPAHLAYKYIYIYRTWSDVGHMTWQEAGAFTWGQLKGESI